MRITPGIVIIAFAITAIIALTMGAAAILPYYNTSYASAPAMNNTHPGSGAIAGRITTSNSSAGLAYAYVAVVNASNTSQAFYAGMSDAHGYYQFRGVNNTYYWDSVLGGRYLSSYKVYANHSQYGEGLSNAFPVEGESTSPANVYIVPRPAMIVVTAERNNLAADGADYVNVTAYATDAAGDAVPDGTLINFTITADDPHHVNGSLSLDGNFPGSVPPADRQYLSGVQTLNGRANVTFGWVDEAYAGNTSTINASYAADHSINGSTGIYFSPTLASWFGSVQDSFGKPYGGAVVTLHLMGTVNGVPVEYYNMTTTSYVDLPYPGSYVFDGIERNSSITYGYATAQADIGDGLVYYGKSDNYTLNKTRTSRGFIVLHVPMPDDIDLAADPDSILAGGDQSVITAQLYLNGKPYKRSGVTVTFFGDNDTRAYLPSVNANVSDSYGRATIIMTSNLSKGDVTVTGYTRIGISRNVSGTTVVHVVGWGGTISGVVTDKNKNGMPNATVKLWTVKWANDTYENVALVRSPNNPQHTVSRPEIAAIGTYTYYMVPAGIYNLTAEKADSAGNVHTWFAWVNLTAGTATNNVVLPDYAGHSLPTYHPPPVVQTTPVPATPIPAPATTIPSSTPVPGFGMVMALAGLLVMAYLAGNKKA